MSRNAHIDGKLRGFEAPRDVASPTDRAPHRLTTAASEISTTGKILEFAAWARWLFVEDDGGGSLILTTQDGVSRPAATGSMIFLPNTRVRVAYVGTAPTSSVKLCGYTSEDAAVIAASSRSSGSSSSGSRRFVAQPVIDATSDGELVVGSADGVVSRIIYDPTNDSGTVVWVGSEAQVTAFGGLPLLEGGYYDLPGVLYVAVPTGSVKVYTGQFVV